MSGPPFTYHQLLSRQSASYYFDPIFATALASRLFCRAAVLRWMRFLRPARSSTFWAASNAFAASSAVPAERTFLTALRSWLRWARLRSVRVFVCRMAFLADLVRGTINPGFKSVQVLIRGGDI